MLVLSRKVEQKILIGSDVVITVIAVNGNRVKFGIEAPQNVRILRTELMTNDTDEWDDAELDATSNDKVWQVLENSSVLLR